MNLRRIFLCAIALGIVFRAAAQSVATPAPLVVVSNAPLIQMLVPGFTVRQLPVDLNNINCFAYAPDGRLFALCYDGDVVQLKDTDGDGLEDTASFFYKNDHGEIPPSIGMAWGPGGLYVASQKRVIRLKDLGDGTSQLETVTSNWISNVGIAGSGIDSEGMAVDASGAIYFCLGCDNWMSAYRVNTNGQSEYNLHSERGTILKVSPDWKSRETVCTGIRFAVSLAFNTNGDLFCTDQEGATWLPNGNPFDELLFIEKGRHYGFPPRHPKYLPDVIDEPSVFDYGPQHQSTCGVHFNVPVGGGDKIFGPDWWRGDAIIAGESRGKIFRTKLIKTDAGYVAQNQLIGCLKMLTIDAIPTPQGDLLVTCHSGAPDWGSGPQGKGKLFKVSYTDAKAPQPVLTYAASPTEMHIVFDKPLNPEFFKNLASQVEVTAGKYVVAGERYETFTPGYEMVNYQHKQPRYNLPVLSAGITADNRTIVLQTVPRDAAVCYAVKLPEARTIDFMMFNTTNNTNIRPFDTNRHELPQFGGIDVAYDLTGVEATWQSSKKKGTNWSGWLPHLDLNVARAFTAASAGHAKLFEFMRQRGTLRLRAQLDLTSMLHPAVQPISKLDYSYPNELVTVIVKSKSRFELNVPAGKDIAVHKMSSYEYWIGTVSHESTWLPLEIELQTGKGDPDLEISWFTDEDPRPRAFPLRRILVPWAKREVEGAFTVAPQVAPQIAGGDWENGRKIFYGDKVACYKCHTIAGQGGKIGPDLSNLIYRDYDSVYRDVTQPSAAINPDHIAYNISLKNGEVETGVIMDTSPANVVIGQATGKDMTLNRSDIVNMKASTISLMPEGLLQGLNAQQQKDLFTFLLSKKP